MTKRLEIIETIRPESDARCRAGEPFKLYYVARNQTSDSIEGHYDVIQIQDEFGRVMGKPIFCWYTYAQDWSGGPLTKGGRYTFLTEKIDPPLPAGVYRVWLTLDGGATAGSEPNNLEAQELKVYGEDEEGPAADSAAASIWTHQHHIAVVTKPDVVEPLEAGLPFEIRYEAYNEGGQWTPRDGHVDGFWIDGTQATWWTEWRQDRLGPGQHYWPTIQVPGLPAGDYKLRWKFDTGTVSNRPPHDGVEEGPWFRIQGVGGVTAEGGIPTVTWLAHETVLQLVGVRVPEEYPEAQADQFWSALFANWMRTQSSAQQLAGLSYLYQGIIMWQGKTTGYSVFCDLYLNGAADTSWADPQLKNDVLEATSELKADATADEIYEKALPAMEKLARQVEGVFAHSQCYPAFAAEIRKLQAQMGVV